MSTEIIKKIHAIREYEDGIHSGIQDIKLGSEGTDVSYVMLNKEFYFKPVSFDPYIGKMKSIIMSFRYIFSNAMDADHFFIYFKKANDYARYSLGFIYDEILKTCSSKVADASSCLFSNLLKTNKQEEGSLSALSQLYDNLTIITKEMSSFNIAYQYMNQHMKRMDKKVNLIINAIWIALRRDEINSLCVADINTGEIIKEIDLDSNDWVNELYSLFDDYDLKTVKIEDIK